MDISQDTPTTQQWEQAEELPIGPDGKDFGAPTHRQTGNGPCIVHPPVADRTTKTEEQRIAENKRKTWEETSGLDADDGDWEMLPAEPSHQNPGGEASGHRDHQEDMDLHAFYAIEENLTAVELSIEMPTSKRGWKKFAANPEAYLCSVMKRKQLEVNGKKLTKEEILEFIKAKQKEGRNFVASECFEAARKQLMRARWLACVGYFVGKLMTTTTKRPRPEL